MNEKVHLIIKGDVQGVGFRFRAIEIARDLGLTGWVKNNPDDSVEIVAEGEKDALQNLITWSKKGPPVAKVSNLQITWQKATGEFEAFTVKY